MTTHPKPEPSRKTSGGRANQARVVAHSVVMRVLRDHAWADRTLSAAFERAGLDERDRALATELVYGTLRHAVRLDYLLGKLASRPLRKLPPATLAALRLGAYQLLEMRVPDYSAVNEAVLLIRRDYPHQAGFVNAVLREIGRRRDAGALPDPERDLADPIEALAVAGSHPLWLLRELGHELGDEEVRALVAANNTPAPTYLRVNRRHATRDAVRDRLGAAGVATEAHPRLPDTLAARHSGSPTSWPGFAEGQFTIQDAAAQLVGYLAHPDPGMLVLDLCAAPGGKATHLGELMQDEGAIIALDVHPGRTRLVAQAAERLGLKAITTAVADATDVSTVRAQLTPFGRSDADLVLLDAPCSGFGTLRRNPELRERDQESQREICALQAHLLDAAAQVVKPGGAIVYAVCTIMRTEGPEQIERFLSRHPELELASVPELLLPYAESRGGSGAYVRTWPHRHDMDGFFAARLERRSPSGPKSSDERG